MSTSTETPHTHAYELMAPTSVHASTVQPANALVLPDGSRLRLRPLGIDDRDGLAALFARLSPESRYRRFLAAKPKLTIGELTYLTDIDHVHHEAIAAVDQHDGSIVGIGRYAHVADRAGIAEVAVEVADELQGMGIGTALATRIVQRARANGFTLLTATTLWENRPARALLRCLGFRARASHGSEIELELELDPLEISPRRRTGVSSPLSHTDSQPRPQTAAPPTATRPAPYPRPPERHTRANP